MSDHHKRIALKHEIARALPNAPERVIEGIYRERVPLLSGYEFNEAGFLVSLGGGTVQAEIENMRKSGAYADLFSEDQPAAPAREAGAGKRSEPTVDDLAGSISHARRIELMMNQPAPSQKSGAPKPAPTGIAPEALAKMSPMDKIAAANEARAKRDGWDYDGRGGAR